MKKEKLWQMHNIFDPHQIGENKTISVKEKNIREAW
jgi:hypothetical protein